MHHAWSRMLSCADCVCHGLAHQAPLFMGLSRQEYWSRFPCSPPGDLPDPRIEPASPALAGRFFTTEPPGKSLAPWCVMLYIKALFNLCHFSNRMSSYCSLMKLILFIIIKIYSPLVFIFILYPFFKKSDYSIFFLLNWKSLLHTKDFLHQYLEARKNIVNTQLSGIRMSSFQFHVHQKQTIIIWSGYITVNLYRISIFPFPRPVLHWTNTVLLWWLSCGASGWLFWILHCMKRMGFRKSEAWLHSYNLYKNCRRRTCFSLLTFKTEITRMTFISHGDHERQFAG